MHVDRLKAEILDRLPDEISKEILRLLAVNGVTARSESIAVNEIRLRAGRPLAVIINGKELMTGSQYLLSERRLAEVFARLCRNSPYAFAEDIKNGFITLVGGHRVGIVGRVLQGGGIRDISGLAIRVSQEVKGCGLKVLPHIIRSNRDVFNTLVISPPCAGKTTLIRDVARLLSSGTGDGRFLGVNVGIVDERSEIAAMNGGLAGHDVGIRTDVCDGVKKQRGIFMMLRSMSPRIIVTDEVGSEGDFASLEAAMNSGVRIIATAHGNSVEDIKARREIANMIREGFFEKYVVLSAASGPGTVEKLC